MVARGRGHLRVHVLAGRARPRSPGTSVYAATKFGLRGFALALREDLAPKGVGVSVILPGSSATRACSPSRAPSSRPSSAPRRPEDVAARGREGDRAQPRRARRRAAAAARRRRCSRRSRPGPIGAIQRKLGAAGVDRGSRSASAARARGRDQALGALASPSRRRRRRAPRRRASGRRSSEIGVAWMRTTTSSASISSSAIVGSPRTGVGSRPRAASGCRSGGRPGAGGRGGRPTRARAAGRPRRRARRCSGP